MKAMFSKSILAGAVAVASLFAGANAHAQTQPVYPDFTVKRPDNGNTFVADKIVAGYVERISFVEGSQAGQGSFTVDLFFDFSAFWKNNGGAEVDRTGLNDSYDVYGFYTATGTFAPNATNTGTTFTFTPGSTSSLSVYLDGNNDNEVIADGRDGVLPSDFTGIGIDDVLLATGTGIFGEGNLTPDTSCQMKGDCGSFTAITSFNLTTAGSAFFVAPNPFFNIAIERGQLNNFPVSDTQIINGSLDITFEESARVPEPASLGLLGLGLLGLGAARRRKQAK